MSQILLYFVLTFNFMSSKFPSLSDFQLHDVIALFGKWKKQLLTFVISITVLASLIVFILPQKFLATAVCFPSNPLLADKSFIFNENIQSLYATYGSSAELERLMSTAQLDTLYRFAAYQFDLRKRYKISDTGALGLKKTIKEFKENYNIEKTVLGELKIHVWDEDAKRSAQMANSIVAEIGNLSSYQNNGFNTKILVALKEQYELEKKSFITLADTIENSNLKNAEKELIALKKKSITDNLVRYEKLINEFSVAVRANAPGLQIQEYATPQAKPDKPEKLSIVFIAFLLSCFFGLLLMFTLENRRS